MSRNAPSLCDLPRWAVRRTGQVTMALGHNMLHSAVRITSVGDLLGTGFIVTVDSETIPGHSHGYVVTAHHVIARHLEIAMQASDPFTNGDLYPPVTVEDWRQPIDGLDLAVAPVPIQPGQKYCRTRLETAMPTDQLPLPRLGERIYYIGIFEPLKRPMARSGTIGALEQSGIGHEGGYVYDAHLVDCRSYQGFSGSPCVAGIPAAVLNAPPPIDREAFGATQLAAVGDYTMLCGMFTAHYSDEASAGGVVSRYGVGVMLPSGEIRRALMTEEAKQERRRWDEEHTEAEKRAQPPLRNANAGQFAEGEYGRFEDLTRKLVNVPKKELDEAQHDDDGSEAV
jgi:hypothetical protein